MLTTPVLDSYTRFCAEEGIDVGDLRSVIRDAYREARADDPIVLIELGRIEPEAFEVALARTISAGLGREIPAAGLARRIVGGTVPDEAMLAAVGRARAAGVRTGLLSNSWGTVDYPETVTSLFDTVVISARVGLRKPDPAIFELTARGLGLEPSDCVFVDDARPNCEAAEALGMPAILHRSAADTIPRLERELGIALG